MKLTLEDVARLRPLLESAIAEATTDGMVKPDRPQELQESLDWGQALLKRIEEMPEQKFGVWILWGAMPEPGTVPTRYEFDTQMELDAFLMGVEESNGWMEYRTQEDEKPWPDPEEPVDEDE